MWVQRPAVHRAGRRVEMPSCQNKISKDSSDKEHVLTVHDMDARMVVSRLCGMVCLVLGLSTTAYNDNVCKDSFDAATHKQNFQRKLV